MGRKKKPQEMSGIFDRFFKKKDPEQKSLFEMIHGHPTHLPVTPSGNLPTIPKEEKKSPFSFLAPKPKSSEPKPKALTPFSIFERQSQLPVKAEPKKPTPFSVLTPKTERPSAPPPPSRPAVVFPMAPVEEEREVREIFKPVLKTPVEPPKSPYRYVFLRPSAPPETIQVRPYGLPAPATAPVMEWTMPTPSQLAELFKKMNLPQIWEMIRSVRERPDFLAEQRLYYSRGLPMMIPIDPVVFQETYTDFANFYGIPWSVMAMYLEVQPEQQKEAEEALWNNVLSPLNAMVPEAFEILKPPDLPGFFNVSFTEPGGQYWLYYIEPLLPPDAPGGNLEA